jgi:hypothetical protein
MEKNLVKAEIARIMLEHSKANPLIAIKTNAIERILTAKLIGEGDDRLYMYFGDVRHNDVCVPSSKIISLKLAPQDQIVQIVNLYDISEGEMATKLQRLSDEIERIKCSMIS